MSYELTFIIHPEAESVSLNLFEKSLHDIHRLVKDVDYSVTKESGARRWIISHLHSSSPTISLRPVLDNDETISALVDGLDTIKIGGIEPPPHFSEDVLDDLLQMRRLFKGKDKVRLLEFSLNGHKAIIQPDTAGKVDRILRSGYTNIGSLEGSLDAVNLHNNPTFTIWDRVTRAPVRCHFPKNDIWKRKIKTLLEKRVSVSGEINYFGNGMPRSVTNIMQIEDVTPEPGLKRATFGSITCDEASVDPAAFVRKIRREIGNGIT